MPDKFASAGKQVLKNGGHFADAIHPVAADQIVTAFESRESIALYLEREARNRGRSAYFRQLLKALAGNVRARLDVVEVAPEGVRARYNGDDHGSS